MTRLRSPIKPRGVHTARWEKWRERSRTAVVLRAGYQCEACGTRMRPLEWAHMCGRRNIISEPYASLPELTMALCSGKYDELGCHEKIDRAVDLDLLRRLRWEAFTRLSLRYGASIGPGFSDPLDAIREAVRKLERIYEFDAERLQLVRR